ncbi:VOC family protein [Arthrobacter sp. TmT3-37]
MLRVRPILHTSDPTAARDFLHALGLASSRGALPDGAQEVFDAGSGRVALHPCASGSPEDGSVSLAFDVSDVREFARRTIAAGTPVDLVEGHHGTTARIIAPDGTPLLAAAGPRETTAPASSLSVLARWQTPDVGSAVRVLEDIGARPRAGSDAGTGRAFRAKNGGLVTVELRERPGVGMAFEHDGDVRDLVAGLTAAGVDAGVVGGGRRSSLRLRAPWGAVVRIDGRQQDVHD